MHWDPRSGSRLAVMLVRVCLTDDYYYAVINVDTLAIVHYFKVLSNSCLVWHYLLDTQRTGSDEFTIVGGGGDGCSSIDDFVIFFYKTYHQQPANGPIAFKKWLLPHYDWYWVCTIEYVTSPVETIIVLTDYYSYGKWKINIAFLTVN